MSILINRCCQTVNHSTKLNFHSYKLHEVNPISEIFKGGKCVMRDFSLKFEKRLIKNFKIFTVGPIKTSE